MNKSAPGRIYPKKQNTRYLKAVVKSLRLIPAFFSFLLMAAHFQRAGASFLVVICVLSTFLLFFNRPWSNRVVRLLLFLSAIEWLRTLIYLVQLRQEAGLPWVRLAVILGGVLLFTLASALVFRKRSSKNLTPRTGP